MRSGWQRDKTYNLSTNFADTDTRDAERYARRVAAKDDAELRAVLANGATRPVSAAHALRSLQVLGEFILCTVTFCANPTDNLT